MNHVDKRTQGFTMIELLLAMGFISALLLGIAMTIIQISTIYNKGMTSKEMNQISRSIGDELTRSISAGASFSMTNDYSTNAAGGRLCLGSFSYIWNNARPLVANHNLVTPYANGASQTGQVRFVKVEDPSRLYCAKNAVTGAFTQKDITVADALKSTEMLKVGERDLAMYSFSIFSPPSARDAATNQQLYTISYTIGTMNVNAVNPEGTACLAPGAVNADFNYCTVGQFTIVIRTGNGVN